MPLVFTNPGTIPLAAVRTFGVSVKERDDAIGFFGTGLKYAVAIWLRLGCKVTLFTEGQRMPFYAAGMDIRGKRFDLVCMEDDTGHRELGFTTELGKTWEAWMAFREMYCNAVDEGGDVMHVKEPLPDCYDAPVDRTLFVVEGPAAERAWEERHLSILTTPAVVTGAKASAHVGAGQCLYYRGIRVADLRNRALYDYNVHHAVDLTEDRTLKYQFQARMAVESLILCSDNRDFLRKVLQAPRGTYESDLDYTETSTAPSEAFLEVVGEMRGDCSEGLNGSAAEVHRQYASKHVLPHDSVELTKVEQRQLDKAIAACRAIGCDMDRYPITVLEHLGPEVWGRAENFRIYLSRRAFGLGTKVVAGTLFEEYIHLAEHLRDETRGMQNWLIDKIMSLHEEQVGEPL